MIIEVIKTIAVGCVVTSIATYLYVHILLVIAKVSSGAIKFVLAMVPYLVISVVLVAPLVFLVSDFRFVLKESAWSMIYVLIAYGVTVFPSFYYLGKVKLIDLRKAGYFRPRY
jgi:hypothetical protein